MKLLQTMAGAHHGGAEKFFERLAAGLQQVGVSQRTVIRPDNERVERLRAAGISVTQLPFGGLFDLTTAARLRKIISEYKPDIVLSWMNRATKFCPRGAFVHVARLGGYYNLKYYKQCDHLIGNTRGIVDYIRKAGWPEDRVHYLPNFVMAEKAQPVSRASLNVREGVPLILAMGRLHKNKGFDVLLNALALLPRFHLMLAGEGPERATLEAQARKLGIADRVHMLGWRSDSAALLAAADVFVCSSRHEPLGNVVIEAWVAGVPVVAAASDGPRELIQHSENGLLVPVENADGLVDAIKDLADNAPLRARLVAAGKQAYESEFSEARVIGLYREFFERVRK